MTSKTPSNPPSGDLEKRLRSILEKGNAKSAEIGLEGWSPDAEDEAIAQILTAIKDAGYISPTQNAPKNVPDWWSKGVGKQEFMTGQEWYDRFSNEFRGFRANTIVSLNISEVIEAAKRAAGIEE